MWTVYFVEGKNEEQEEYKIGSLESNKATRSHMPLKEKPRSGFLEVSSLYQ